MSSNDTVQPNSADTSDWNRAWQAVAKLATARESLQEIPRTHSFSEPEHAQYAGSDVRAHTRSYWSVWILIGAIWISATFVVATAAGAILYILG
jgi:hypothetical protein